MNPSSSFRMAGRKSWRLVGATRSQFLASRRNGPALSQGAIIRLYDDQHHQGCGLVGKRLASSTTKAVRKSPLVMQYNKNSTRRVPPIERIVPSFKVAKVSYDGSIETLTLRTSELLRSASIYARDLITLNVTSRQERKLRIHYAARASLSAIVPRDSIILLSFGNVRAVAGLDEVYILDAHSPPVLDFARELAGVYQKGDLEGEPNELVFLEHVLKDTVDSFNRRLRLLDPIVDSFLDRVANEVYSDTGVHLLVPLKDALLAFDIQVKQCLDCLTDLLNQDDEMLELLLTEQAAASKTDGEVEFSRHEHVELLLGVYARQLSTISMEIGYLLARLQSKQEFVALALAGYRNRMIRMNVNLSIGGLTLAIGTTVAGFYGMNVVNGLEASTTAFNYILLGSGLSGLIVATGSFSYLSGNVMRQRAAQRLDEIETLTNALSDLGAVDYTLKVTVERGDSLDKERFEKLLNNARDSKKVTKKEVDLLFDVFDRTEDGQIASDDFNP